MVPAQVQVVLGALHRRFGAALKAVWLHGSAAAGRLRPQSDLDLLAVLDRSMTLVERAGLLADLLRISAPHPAPSGGPRCVELIVILADDIAAPAFPARAEFVYGEWLRRVFEAGGVPAPLSDPEITLVLAEARQGAVALAGPAADVMLRAIPAEDIRRAMRDLLPRLIAGLDGDEGNTLLTLARMWHTAETGTFASKEAAAARAVLRLPPEAAAVLHLAREVHLGRAGEDWNRRPEAVRRAADELAGRVAALLGRGGR